MHAHHPNLYAMEGFHVGYPKDGKCNVGTDMKRYLVKCNHFGQSVQGIGLDEVPLKGRQEQACISYFKDKSL